MCCHREICCQPSCHSLEGKIRLFGKFHFIYFIYLFYLFSFLASPQHMELLRQESDASHSYDPCHSCGTARSLTHCSGPRIELASEHSRDAADLVAPQPELQHCCAFDFSPFYLSRSLILLAIYVAPYF